MPEQALSGIPLGLGMVVKINLLNMFLSTSCQLKSTLFSHQAGTLVPLSSAIYK